jgi:hypothetical protein
VSCPRLIGVTRGYTKVIVTILSTSTSLADWTHSHRQNGQLNLRSSVCGYTCQFLERLLSPIFRSLNLAYAKSKERTFSERNGQ